MSKRTDIIQQWGLNPNRSLDEIADECFTTKDYVSTVLSEHYLIFGREKPLWLVPSFACNKTKFFLFDGFCERTVDVKVNYISNVDDFTSFELDWMYENYNLKSPWHKDTESRLELKKTIAKRRRTKIDSMNAIAIRNTPL